MSDVLNIMMQIKLDARVIIWLRSQLQNGDFEAQDESEEAALASAIEEADDLVQDYDLMRRASLILETDTFIAFEHPKYGDEVSLMIWDKVGDVGLIIETPFRDVDDPEEIREYMQDLREEFANG